MGVWIRGSVSGRALQGVEWVQRAGGDAQPGWWVCWAGHAPFPLGPSLGNYSGSPGLKDPWLAGLGYLPCGLPLQPAEGIRLPQMLWFQLVAGPRLA